MTFSQNLGLGQGEIFTHSWSLSIEEQFYLIFPIIALLIAYSRRSIGLAWTALVGVMLLAMFLRGFNWYAHGEESISARSFMEHIYYSSFTRFDELLPGVAIALLKNFHPIVYAALLRRGNMLLLAGLASVGLMFYLFQVLKTPLTDYGIDINAGLGMTIIMTVSIFCGWALYFFVDPPPL